MSRDESPETPLPLRGLGEADHASPERVERVWERLQQSLADAELDGGAAHGRTRAWRWGAVPIALAAGFALGVAVGGRVGSPGADVDVAPAPEASIPPVLAAGRVARRYTLPSGAVIELAPHSIVDAGARAGSDGKRELRLLQGEATLMVAASPAATEPAAVTLLVGSASVAATGTTRIRLEGDRAELEVLAGSADVTAPDGERGSRLVSLGPRDRATVPVRARAVASRASDALEARGASEGGAAEDGLATRPRAPNAVAPKSEEGPPPLPAWMSACEQGDYSRAVELLTRDAGDAGAAAAGLRSPSHLMCIGSGLETRKNSAAAMRVLERVVQEFPDDPNALAAASNLARIHQSAGNAAKAQEYQRKAQELSKGSVLSAESLLGADALCAKIENEAQLARATAGRTSEVVRLSRLYTRQFPDGPCTERIVELLRQLGHDVAPDPHAGDDEPREGEP